MPRASRGLGGVFCRASIATAPRDRLAAGPLLGRNGNPGAIMGGYRARIGAAMAAVVVGGTWQVEQFPWVWMINPITMQVWLASFALILVGTILAFSQPRSVRWLLAGCGALCLALNAAALMVFLWAATVSGGGV